MHKHILSDKRNDKVYIQSMLDYYRANKNLVREFSHDEYPNLKGFDYTSECEFSQSWNEFTKVARGLVIDTNTLEIITFPFPKFMNLTQPGCEISVDEFYNDFSKFDIYMKMDGSLGIIFYYANKWHIMTRGSFHSEQAKRGQKMLDELLESYYECDRMLATGRVKINRARTLFDYTYTTETVLVEIIYPENRIVVDYGSDSKLVTLGAYILTNDDYTWYTGMVDKYCFANHNQLYDCLNSKDHNFEGFVIVAPDGRRCKIKGDAYLKVHKIRTNITPNSIIENILLEYEKTNDYDKLAFNKETMMMLPEEFRKEIEDSIAIVQTALDKYIDTIGLDVQLVNQTFALGNSDYVDMNIFDKDHKREVMIYVQKVAHCFGDRLSQVIATIAANTGKTFQTFEIPSKLIVNFLKNQGKDTLKQSMKTVEHEE